jgi:hypothetical protein
MGLWDEWYNSNKFIFTYDTLNNNTEELEQSWNSDLKKWDNYEKWTHTFNSYNITESLAQLWNFEQWFDSRKVSFEYDIHNNRTGWIDQTWDGQWKNVAKVAFTYNTQNNLCSRLSQLWNNTQWENYDSVSFILDAQNNLTAQIYLLWSNEWENDHRVDYYYDENNNATSGYFKIWTDDTWVEVPYNVLIFNVYYNNMQSMLFSEFGHRFTATYIKPNELGVKENTLLTNPIKLYPNPVSDILHIETENDNVIPEVKIYSIQGILLRHTKESRIDVSSLSNGVYIVEINGIARKIVKY